MIDATGIVNKIERLANTASRNEKINKLVQYLQDPEFMKVVVYTLNPYKQYKINVLPKQKEHKPGIDIFKILDTLSTQRGVSHLDKQFLADICPNNDTRILVKKIINKDLKCGCDSKTINKACSGLVPVIPYQRCSTIKKLPNIQYPCYVQTKLDGMFFYAVVNQQEIKFISRKGHEFIFAEDHLEKDFAYCDYGQVYMGEFLVQQQNKFLDRKTGNGIITKALKGTITPEESKNIVAVVWDMVSIKKFNSCKSNTIYNDRFTDLNDCVCQSDSLQIVNTIIAKDKHEAKEFTTREMEKGEEGTIYKNFNGVWKNNTSADMVKVKAEIDCELKITGVLKGKKGTKYENVMGALSCESEDGVLKVNIGGGFSDMDRTTIPWLDYIGTICTVRFNEVIQDKNGNAPSLFLPRFIELRPDKDIADTYKYIKDLK